MIYEKLIKPILFHIDPEHAHHLMVDLGKFTAKSPFSELIFSNYKTESKPFEWNGLRFKNRVGLAAGFDKNATMLQLMSQLGFGFLEIGSITAQSSVGNKKPRMFRLPTDEAVINRMGLNNVGAQESMNNLKAFITKQKPSFPIGVNIAKTHSPLIYGDDAVQDYVNSFILAEPLADYLTINISCPNTEEGKTFEDPEVFYQLMNALGKTRKTNKPVLVKFSVDATTDLLDELIQISQKFKVDGYLCSNTSSTRSSLNSTQLEIDRIGKGGLSGKPIFDKSLSLVEHVRKMDKKALLIGIGGIDSDKTAEAYIKAGADLVQIYTGLVYKGPYLPKSIVNHFNKEHLA